jgi:transcriptional regulator with XRE-family HTH domain
MGSDEGGWRQELRAARKRLGLSQHALAANAGVSVDALRKYENGQRHPSRPHLIAVLDALRLERGSRSEILEGAGYVADGMDLRPYHENLFFSRDEAAVEVERYRWPAFVTNEYMELVAANRTIRRLWDVDLDSEFATSEERNLLTAATNPRFADCCLSWDETVGRMAAIFKGHHRGAEDPASPGPYFQKIVEILMRYDPQYFARIVALWEKVEPQPAKLRWSYPVVWQHPRAGVMRFTCFASSANERDGLSFNDWIPDDAETWHAIARLLAE